MVSGHNPKRVPKDPSLRRKTAGEIVHVKDQSASRGDFWGWGTKVPERKLNPQMVFEPRHLKPLAKSLRSALMALGHAISAYNAFTRIKSRNISPDGNLGGLGYVQKITDMRRQLMNCVEALSAYTDTVYDEMHAPHWNSKEDTLDARTRAEVREIVEQSEGIREDPEAWAEEEESISEEGMARTASSRQASISNVVSRYLEKSLGH